MHSKLHLSIDWQPLPHRQPQSLVGQNAVVQVQVVVDHHYEPVAREESHHLSRTPAI